MGAIAERDEFDWPDWQVVLDRADEVRTTGALRNLARYANPDLVAGLGLGRGGRFALGAADRQGGRADGLAVVWELANTLAGLNVDWTVQRFNPRGRSYQIIRTTEELLEGEATCLDFAVSLAALCIRENIAVTLAIAVPDDAPAVAHAFLIFERSRGSVHEQAAQGEAGTTYDVHGFDEWVRLFRDGSDTFEHHLIDVTPLAADDPHRADALYQSAQGRSSHTLDTWLARRDGWIYTVAVRPAVAEAGSYYRLPRQARDLGVTAWLPDLPADYREFASQQKVRAELEAADKQTVVLIGPRGVGKSTLALARAQRASGGRGWFLDGSDRPTLRRSLAAAEAQSRGGRARNDQAEYVTTMAVRARRRLAATAQPWVVVVDNADGAPDQIIDLLPVPKPGQLLIITTTREQWVQQADERSWALARATGLEWEDLSESERRLGLQPDEYRPGLLRIARSCSPEALKTVAGQPSGAERLVRAALGGAGAGSPPGSPNGLALLATAAAVMPAEHITVAWVAEAAFGGDSTLAKGLMLDAAQRGLVEHSRQSVAARDHEDMPLWMHRAVRAALWQFAVPTEAGTGLRVLAAKRAATARYSAEELGGLAEFLVAVPEDLRSHVYAQAAVAVMELLESRGQANVVKAAEIGSLALPAVDAAQPDDITLRCVILMALARAVSHKKTEAVTAAEIAMAIEQCVVAEAATAHEAGRDERLLYGRAQAMHGILIRKQASLLGDDAENPSKGDLLTESIRILTESYLARRAALTVDGALGDDPDQHVDRGWFNLGGSNIELANWLATRQPDRRPEVITAALTAYAGSLWLRRERSGDPNTMYTAASLSGVALALYMAAIHCPGELTLDGIEHVEELEPVRVNQTRESTLRAAELSAFRALEIRADIDGPMGDDTAKVRDLIRKIALAWTVPSAEPGRRCEELWSDIRPFCKDLGIEDLFRPPAG